MDFNFNKKNTSLLPAIQYNFWLNLYKPKGISSAKLVSIIKRHFRNSKVGHCGTLDVEAEGVLPLAIGEATKLVRLLVAAKKTYIFTVQFGAKTDTADKGAKIVSVTDIIPTEEQCKSICSSFIGILSQAPPAFSAIKINGIRSYQLARRDVKIELKARDIEIYRLECQSFNYETRQATYKVECSKGTYVRTLAEDIALSLQSLGFVVELQRVEVGSFTAENAIRLTELDLQTQETKTQESIKQFLIDKSIKIEAVLDDILVLNATLEQARKITCGQKCYFDCVNSDLIGVKYNDTLLAIGSINENCFNSFRVLNLTP